MTRLPGETILPPVAALADDPTPWPTGRAGARGFRGPGRGATSYIDPPPEWRGTSVQVCGLWPYSAGSGSPMVGVPIGRHLVTAATVCCDPIAWFRRAKLIANPSLFVLGRPGLGKSSLVRRMCLGLIAQGVTPLILGDLKPDYVDLVRAVGGQVVRIGRGIGGLNPLDPGGLRAAVAALSGAAAAELAAQLHGRQVVITGGLIELVRRARLADHEQAAIAAAIAVLDRTHTGVPVLADLVQVLQDAPPQVRTAIWDRGDEQEYARLVDPLLRSLTALISGVFGEVFGGTGTGSGAGAGAVLALDAPAVGLDTSSTPTPMNGCRPRSCWPAGRTGSGRSWDRDGGHRLLALLRERFSTITLVWADSGYAGRLVIWARAVLRLSVTVIKRTDDVRGFVLVPRRWVVERTFGWLSRYRRLVRDYERRPEHHEAMVLWATTMIMVRQLAHQPAHPRWGGERSKPPHIQQAQRAA